MSPPQTETVTFLFTDLEGSTQLWERFPEAMHAALARHDEILAAAVERHAGSIVKTTGDGVHAVFRQPADAVAAAVEAQQRLMEESWGETGGLFVRMGIHTGSAAFRAGDYYGTTLNRGARVMSIAHGGQALVSATTYELVKDRFGADVAFLDQGLQALRGLQDRERVYQVQAAGLRMKFPPLRSLDGVPQNLPVQLTPFVGREALLNDLQHLFEKPDLRLLTLLGPGGTGKTRLSLALAEEQLAHFPNGVFFIELSPIRDPALVPTTIAQTIGVREGGGLPPLENLKAYLKDKTVLLVLDNMEQVVESAGAIAALLQAATGLKCICSSRIPLQISGEHEFPVPPLETPALSAGIADLKNAESVRLFLDRAKTVSPKFEMTSENAHEIAEICRRLDGLPLAIEIAAARAKLMPPRTILARLDKSMQLLTRVARDLPGRQRTMRAAIDWSHDLLSPEDKTLFARLGVFVNGFSIEAVEAVCDSDQALDVFDGIESLLTNSLLTVDRRQPDGSHFTMLKTIRDYALEKLGERGELESIRDSHGQYFASLADKLFFELYSPEAKQALEITEIQYDNYRAALVWSLEDPRRANVGAQIGLALSWFWYRHGHFNEGREWSEKVLNLARPLSVSPVAGLAYATAMMMAMWQGDLKVALDYGDKALSVYLTLEEPVGLSVTLMSRGVTLLNQGKDEEAYPFLKEAIGIFKEADFTWFEATSMVHLANVELGLGHPEAALEWLEKAGRIGDPIGDPWLQAFIRNNKGEVARVKGDFETARAYYEETDRLYKEADAIGDQARLLHTFGYLEMHAGELERSKAYFRESLDEFIELGNKRGIAECMAGLANVAVREGDAERAARLFGAAQVLLTSFGAAWWPADRKEVEAGHALVKEALGNGGAYEELLESGGGMAYDQVIAFARSG